MAKIFISYRRDDSLVRAGRIFDGLKSVFGEENLFMDFTIPIGGDFPKVLRDKLTEADVILVIIGKTWTTITKNGIRRLDDRHDWVRFEVALALERLERDECAVMPILVEGAGMPDISELPANIQKLAPLNALSVRDAQHDFYNDIDRLIKAINPATGEKLLTPPATADIKMLITEFSGAYRAKKWHVARDILATIRTHKNITPSFEANLPEYEKEVYEHIRLAEEMQQHQDEYDIIRQMVEFDSPTRIARAFRTFRGRYPDPAHDLDKLRLLYGRADEILPQPFAWREIPQGKVTLTYKGGYVQEATTFTIPAFHMAKYPVTNAQYDLFVGHPDGYRNPAWWDYSPDAKQWRANQPQAEQTGFAGADRPGSNISWYDAVAFCRWISALTGEKIMLPTEQQWQRAAQGDDGRDYPWGNDWDGARCNNSISPFDSNSTTPVTQFEGKDKGDSPYGVVDMSGNVWEWCLTAYETGKSDLFGTDVRVLRGGSWSINNSVSFRVAYRFRVSPLVRYLSRGFRFARFF